jgi:hypothetical protein
VQPIFFANARLVVQRSSQLLSYDDHWWPNLDPGEPPETALAALYSGKTSLFLATYDEWTPDVIDGSAFQSLKHMNNYKHYVPLFSDPRQAVNQVCVLPPLLLLLACTCASFALVAKSRGLALS